MIRIEMRNEPREGRAFVCNESHFTFVAQVTTCFLSDEKDTEFHLFINFKDFEDFLADYSVAWAQRLIDEPEIEAVSLVGICKDSEMSIIIDIFKEV